jgi:hypothetical protein
MDSVILVHSDETFTVPAVQAISKCDLFQKNPALTALPYRVQSPVTLSVFQEFVSELEGNSVNITDTNLTALQLLCEEFGFDEFAAKLSDFFERSPKQLNLRSEIELGIQARMVSTEEISGSISFCFSIEPSRTTILR